MNLTLSRTRKSLVIKIRLHNALRGHCILHDGPGGSEGGVFQRRRLPPLRVLGNPQRTAPVKITLLVKSRLEAEKSSSPEKKLESVMIANSERFF